MAAVHDCGFELVDHCPNAPTHHFLFPNMKKALGWKAVLDRDKVISAVEDFLEDQVESFDTIGIQAPQHWWKKCVDCKGH